MKSHSEIPPVEIENRSTSQIRRSTSHSHRSCLLFRRSINYSFHPIRNFLPSTPVMKHIHHYFLVPAIDAFSGIAIPTK
jgi:hypothetical protein